MVNQRCPLREMKTDPLPRRVVMGNFDVSGKLMRRVTIRNKEESPQLPNKTNLYSFEADYPLMEMHK